MFAIDQYIIIHFIDNKLIMHLQVHNTYKQVLHVINAGVGVIFFTQQQRSNHTRCIECKHTTSPGSLICSVPRFMSLAVNTLYLCSK
jgi:hypothetical protein